MLSEVRPSSCVVETNWLSELTRPATMANDKLSSARKGRDLSIFSSWPVREPHAAFGVLRVLAQIERCSNSVMVEG